MSDGGAGRMWLVGCGNMGSAMLARWIAAGRDPASVVVIDPGAPAIPSGVTLATEPPTDMVPETIVLAVKPQQLGAVVPVLGKVPARLLVSILAGVEVAALRHGFAARAIVRAMPNLPVAIGAGVTALHAVGIGAEAELLVRELIEPLGAVEWIVDERHFDAVTALSGSGPGFLFRFVDALAEAGVALGLPPDQAGRLALATVAGSAAMVRASGETPAALADRVASPGGSTRAGLNVLDADGALAMLLQRTLAAAARRNGELAQAARGGPAA